MRNGIHFDRLVMQVSAVAALTALTALSIDAQSLTRGRGAGREASGASVTQVPLDHIVISAPSGALYSGATRPHIAKGVWRDGTERRLTGATWRSSDPAIATVDSTGIVTARKAGIVTISAEAGGVRGTKTYAVTPKPAERLLIDLPSKPIRSGDTV
jgi:hypothetical protein